MSRSTALPMLGLVLVCACQDTTAPDRMPELAGPAMQQSPPGPSEVQCVGTLPPGTYQNIIVPRGPRCLVTNSVILGNITVLEGGELFAGSNTIAGSIQAFADTDLSLERNAISGALQMVGGRRIFMNGGSVDGGISIVEGRPRTPLLNDIDIRSARVTKDIYLSKNTGSILLFDNVLETGNITVADNVVITRLMINTNTVAGNIHVIKNSGAEIEVTGNIITNLLLLPTTPGRGNVKVEDNVVPLPHRMFVQFNRTYQNVQVFKNTGTGTKFVNNNTASESVQCWENTPLFFGNPNTAPKLEGQCGVPPTAF